MGWKTVLCQSWKLSMPTNWEHMPAGPNDDCDYEYDNDYDYNNNYDNDHNDNDYHHYNNNDDHDNDYHPSC